MVEGKLSATTDLWGWSITRNFQNSGTCDSLPEPTLIEIYGRALRKWTWTYKIVGGLSSLPAEAIKDSWHTCVLCGQSDGRGAFKRIINYPKRGMDTSVDKVYWGGIDLTRRIWASGANATQALLAVEQAVWCMESLPPLIQASPKIEIERKLLFEHRSII